MILLDGFKVANSRNLELNRLIEEKVNQGYRRPHLSIILI